MVVAPYHRTVRVPDPLHHDRLAHATIHALRHKVMTKRMRTSIASPDLAWALLRWVSMLKPGATMLQGTLLSATTVAAIVGAATDETDFRRANFGDIMVPSVNPTANDFAMHAGNLPAIRAALEMAMGITGPVLSIVPDPAQALLCLALAYMLCQQCDANCFPPNQIDIC
jgi:hypothetical protein